MTGRQADAVAGDEHLIVRHGLDRDPDRALEHAQLPAARAEAADAPVECVLEGARPGRPDHPGSLRLAHRFHGSIPFHEVEIIQSQGGTHHEIEGPHRCGWVMSVTSRRPLSLNHLRAFEAVARTLSFNAAADELSVTQSAVSRQIKSLEDELGSRLFQRGTRHVRVSPDGAVLLKAVEPLLGRLDVAVKQIRRGRTRRYVAVSTFASFGSLWLLPKIEGFQRAHADIDIRVFANDALADLDDPELDLALRYCLAEDAGAGAVRLFGEAVTPVVSRGFWARVQEGAEPPLGDPRDLVHHTFIEQEDLLSSLSTLEWRHWLELRGLGDLQPRRWISLSYTYQQVQAALAGQGVALARVPMVVDALARGELVEPFGAEGRLLGKRAYWRVAGKVASSRPEVEAFRAWVDAEAAATRLAIGDG